MTWCHQGNLPFEITHPRVLPTVGLLFSRNRPSRDCVAMTWCHRGNLPFEITHPRVLPTVGLLFSRNRPSRECVAMTCCTEEIYHWRSLTLWCYPRLAASVARVTNNMAILVHVWNFCVTGSLVCVPLLIALQIGNQPDLSTFWMMEYVE